MGATTFSYSVELLGCVEVIRFELRAYIYMVAVTEPSFAASW
jgi:hypothetical protein